MNKGCKETLNNHFQRVLPGSGYYQTVVARVKEENLLASVQKAPHLRRYRTLKYKSVACIPGGIGVNAYKSGVMDQSTI